MAEIPSEALFFCEQEEALSAALADFRRRLPEFAQVRAEYVVLESDNHCYFRFQPAAAGQAFKGFLAAGGCPDVREVRCPVARAFIVSSAFAASAQ